MRSSLLLLLLLQTVFLSGTTFIREYTYRASEQDSKLNCRAIVTQELRIQLLNEIGTYVESERTFKIEEIDGEYTEEFSEEIITLCTGITEFAILEEKWNGETYWMKASITVDEEDLQKKLTALVKERKKEQELKQKEEDQELERTKKELEKTKKELREIKTSSKNKATKSNSTNTDKRVKETPKFLSVVLAVVIVAFSILKELN